MSAPLTSDQVDILAAALRRLATILPEQLRLAEAGGRPVELDQQSVGRLSRMDAIAQQSVNREGIRRLRLRIARVNAALRRLEDEYYGD